ncbi:MAG TPA: transglutaminase domain-containing protein [Planctomycetota bacterium]|nr:transglutaminase domain-containing protein [Planctomycetota bacterium]
MPSLRALPRIRFAIACCLSSSLAAQQGAAAAGDVVLDLAELARHHATVAARLDAATPVTLAAGGSCGVRGATTVKLLGTAPATLQLPVPQQTHGQVPLLFGALAKPAAALHSLVLRRDAAGATLVATVQGKNGTEVAIEWNAVVLLAERPEPATPKTAKPFLAATPCAQANDESIRALAAQLAPADAAPTVLAKALQQWLPRQAPKQRPQTLDALGLLASGNHGICTMNANLGVALLRQRSVPARSLAVVPTTGQRLEMHRIVEWFADERWQRFDPSLVHTDVPMRVAQSVVMAITSIDDEERAGKPRMAAPLGCPFGQEVEIVRGPATLFGGDFFWTQALPLAAFDADDGAVAAAAAAWRQFQREGRCSATAEAAAAAVDLAGFQAAWQPR